jgi:hypothetical protein
MGRKRKAGAKRQPNGRINHKHQAFEEGPQQVVLRARRRARKPVPVLECAGRQPTVQEITDHKQKTEAYRQADQKPVTKDQAKSQKLSERGSVLGNWLADGLLTREQVQIGEDYCARFMAYTSLNGLPRATAGISGYGDIRGGTQPDRIKAAVAAKAAHMADQARLRHCTAGVRAAMRRACVTDDPAPLHLVREGIDALK